MSSFYAGLLGDKASKPITNLRVGEKTSIGAVRAILSEYREAKKKGPNSVISYIAKMTSRDYVRLRDGFGFLGASTQTKDLRSDDFIEFSGDKFSNGVTITFAGSSVTNKEQIKQKRAIIDRYRTAMKKNRGFRG
jgi:hypothetical protein